MNIETLLRQHGIPIQVTRVGWVQTRCPYCSVGIPHRKWYLGFNEAQLYCNCWNCGYHLMEETLSRLLNVSHNESLGILRSLGGRTPRDVPKRNRPRELVLPPGLGNLRFAHRNYLEQRGFDPDELVRRWGIRGLDKTGKPSWHLFIPIHFNGRMVSWTARRLSNKEPRYRSCRGSLEVVPHKSLLYGEDYLRNRISVIVHEGPTDVWATGPGAVATLGLQTTPEQVQRIAKYAHRVICFDSSRDAQNRAEKLAGDLSGTPGQTDIVVLDSDDPGSATPKEIEELRRIAGF